MSKLTLDGTAEPVSRDQILRRKRGQGNIRFPCSADHEQDWQPYPVDPYSCYKCDHTTAVAHRAIGLEPSSWSIVINVMGRRHRHLQCHCHDLVLKLARQCSNDNSGRTAVCSALRSIAIKIIHSQPPTLVPRS